MPNKEDKEVEGDFHPGAVIDIYDDLTNHALALRAFGALLHSSDLSDFADQYPGERMQPEDSGKSSLRWGLQQMIDLYLNHQERVLSGYVEKYQNSNQVFIEDAQKIISSIERGAYSLNFQDGLKSLKKALELLDIVKNRDADTAKTKIMRKKTIALINKFQKRVEEHYRIFNDELTLEELEEQLEHTTKMRKKVEDKITQQIKERKKNKVVPLGSKKPPGNNSAA